MIEAHDLTKRYGTKVAVDGISFTVQPGRVTGFLGPNGAGKSTTMRMIVGLDKPTHGSVTVNGKRYAEHHSPLTQVGALLEAKAVHTGRSARNHLRAIAATHGIGDKRVNEVISMTGLDTVAKRRVGGFSLGMGQRLGIAAALVGDPQTLILDEPVNGLDPEGVLWVRNLVKYLAASEGRTVFLSSHLMSEMAVTADHLIVIGRGKIIADGPVDSVIAQATHRDGPRPLPAGRPTWRRRLAGPAVTVTPADGRPARGPRRDRRSRSARSPPRHGFVLHELTPLPGSLEEAYMSLTSESVEYHSAALPGEESAPHGAHAATAAPTTGEDAR